MNSLLARLRSVLIASAVLLGLLVPMLATASAADASTRHHRTCKYAFNHAKYRHNHPHWWAHHCPRMAAKLAGHSVAAAHATRGSAYEQSIANATLALLNRERATYHLRPLTMDSALVAAAQRHNGLMAHYNTMSHQLPTESSLGARLDAAHYHWMWAGENVAWNSVRTTAGVLALQTLMYNEKAPNNGHRLNILNPHFTNVGVHVYIDNAHGKVWLTTDFGSK